MSQQYTRTSLCSGRSGASCTRGTRTSLCSGRSSASCTRGTRTSLCSGFTLLEVMLAFSLLAVGLGLLLAIQSGGLRQVRQAATVSEVSLHAQSLLDRVGVLESITPGVSEGEFAEGRYRWRLSIEPTEDPAGDTASAATTPLTPVGEALAAPVLYRLMLDVSWTQGGQDASLRFVTLRARQPESVRP